MIDAALIQKCADPGLKPAVVEAFIKQAGSEDPLSVTVRSGDRVFLIPKPKTKAQALEAARQYIGKAVIRVGITQYPAGFRISDPSQLSAYLFDPCRNIMMGTALFAKVYRITAQWYKASPPPKEAFDDAIYAWGTGYFDGKYVFAEPDPGDKIKLALPAPENAGAAKQNGLGEQKAAAAESMESAGNLANRLPAEDPNKADTVISLSGIQDYNK